MDKPRFHEAEVRAMKALGVPANIIAYWQHGGGIGKTYAPIVAKVTGQSLEGVLYGTSGGEGKEEKPRGKSA